MIISINCRCKKKKKIRHTLKWAQKDILKILQTSSNLDACPETASRGDFLMLPTEINGTLP